MKTAILGTLQEKVMEILWNNSRPLKPSEVLEIIGKDKYAYTTIMTILKRMVDKKILKREFVGKAYFYSPINNRNEFVEANLKGIYDELVHSYGSLAISQFVDAIKSNQEDLEALKSYLKNNS